MSLYTPYGQKSNKDTHASTPYSPQSKISTANEPVVENTVKPQASSESEGGFTAPLSRTAEGRDLVLAFLLLVPIMLLTNSLIFGGMGIGVSIGACMLLISAFWYIGKKRAKISGYTVICTALAFFLSIAQTLSADNTAKSLGMLAIAVLYTVIITDITGMRRYRSGRYASVLDICSTVFKQGFGRIGVGSYALSHKTDEEGKVLRRGSGRVFLGIAIALPVLLIIVPILMSADAAFENMLDMISEDIVGEFIVTVALGGFGFLIAFAQLFSMRKETAEKKEEVSLRGMDSVVICSFLGVISAVYVLYLISQLAYFFGGFSGLLPEDYTAAEYARRGFFEMCTVCAINLGIIFLATLICRRKEGKLPIAVKALATFISVFSMVLIGAALSKMVLYIDRFGMTRLRILTSVFMVLLAIVFITGIFALFIRKLPYMKVVLIAACTVLLVTCVADTDRIVANYNVGAYLSGKLETVDVDTLSELNTSAVKPLLILYEKAEDETVKTQVRNELNRRFAEYYETEKNDAGNAVITKTNYDLRGFNIPEYSAVKALRDNVQSYYDAEYHENREIYYDDYYYDEEVEYY